jgi:hypothetical protein
MKNLINQLLRTFALLLIPLTIGMSGSAAAVNVFGICSNGAGNTDVCQSKGSTTTNPFISFIKVAITILSVIIGFAAVVVIILSGLTFITAGGDPQAVAKARGSILYALVGLVIAVLSESLVLFVLDKL